MGSVDGHVLGMTKIIDNGPPSKRFNLVLVAEGYQQREMTTFHGRVARFIKHLFATKPFDTFNQAINVYRIDVTSTDSGADEPRACGGSGVARATYFDASFCYKNIARYMCANETLVQNVVETYILEWRQILVIVNSSRWGGSGESRIAVTTTSNGWEDIALHEIGHSAFRLEDEYDYWVGCKHDMNRNNYPGAKPAAPNVTISTKRQNIDWSGFIHVGTPIPTTSNQNCLKCDPQNSPVTAGTVGAFEGASHYHCGVYRPEYDCKMRNVAHPFCAVCQDCISKELQTFPP